MDNKEFNIHEYKQVSFSFLKDLEDSPLKVIESYKQKAKNKSLGIDDSTEAQRHGKIIETAVFYPDEFDNIYARIENKVNEDAEYYKICKIWHEMEKYKNETEENIINTIKEETGTRLKEDTIIKKIKEDWQHVLGYLHLIQSKKIISEDEYAMAMGIRDRLLKTSPMPDILADAVIEPHIEWTNQDSGLNCHGYPDIKIPGKIVYEFKTGFDVSPGRFAGRWGSIKKFKYDMQLAAYREGVGGELPCSIFAVEKKPPYDWAIYDLATVNDNWDIVCALENFNIACKCFQFIKENELWNVGTEFKSMYQYNANEGEWENYFVQPRYKTEIHSMY